MKGSSLGRREFLKAGAATAGAIAFPTLVPSSVFGADAPSNRIRVGAIGCGRIARDADIPGTLKAGGVYVAVCDVDANRAKLGREFIREWCARNKKPAPEIEVFGDYREMLARKDIDAVTISTPDHWHARPVVDAVKAGKHVYVQKPAGRIYAEGRAMRDAGRSTDRIIQFGTQQRSNATFRQACELVRNGRVGTLREVEVGLPTDPAGGNPAAMPVPATLDYDAWLGWTPDVPYTEDRVHPQQGFGRPGWLRCEQYCCGMITGWGVHHMDIAHWGMDTEMTGPVEISGTGEFPTSGLWTVHGPYRLEMKYANGVTLRICDKYPNGIRFIGSEGWVFVSRGGQKATASDPTSGTRALKALDASDPKLLEPLVAPKVRLYESADHYGNWLECIRTGRKPICPIEVGHRSSGVCNIGHIAMRLGRPLKWDPAKEDFVGDAAASAALTQVMRPKYAV
ncbi:MAG: Gfo/Idh/MocA family oxidoreductase [Verrucomicrobia bacterium]|nr:Gfo/Idh/MocA family oxidoreductase [Verrucomicrobiota bacterium]